MMRRCAWCGLDEGEKCASCGLPGRLLAGDALTLCCENLHVWLRGEGGITDTLCADCRKEYFPDERVAVTNSRAVV